MLFRSAYEYRVSGRGGQGIANITLAPRNGRAVAATFPVRQGDDVMLVTDAGRLIRVPADQVRITGRAMQGRQEVVLDGTSRWVTAGYLSDSKPEPEPSLGGQCTNGTTVPAGVSANIRAVHQAVCANFPSITTYGTLRSDGEHSQGIAVDIMVSGTMGQQVADFVRQYSSAMGVSCVIHARRIWSVQRSAEGWRSMADRGSVTANHYDHVHVTTY